MTQLIGCIKWQVTAQDFVNFSQQLAVIYSGERRERVAIPEFDFKKSKEDPKINFKLYSVDEENDELDAVLDDVNFDESGEETSTSNTDQCPVCLMSFKEQLLGTPNNCSHVFCFECIQEWSKVRTTSRTLQVDNFQT